MLGASYPADASASVRLKFSKLDKYPQSKLRLAYLLGIVCGEVRFTAQAQERNENDKDLLTKIGSQLHRTSGAVSGQIACLTMKYFTGKKNIVHLTIVET